MKGRDKNDLITRMTGDDPEGRSIFPQNRSGSEIQEVKKMFS
ncbi:MAG: hypothetical protein Q4A75_04875 [Peptostreptococcaceae bacterium]|nr:hypothetical protein [Peptostreptococcaceae bacterium]